MKISSLVLPSLALGVSTLLVLPGSESNAFTLTGSSLNLGQRDFRVRNNFSDAATNNNTTPDPMFPGQTGVFLATWKGVVEWGSEPHGDGSGDPTQSNLGDGGANFDGFWSGRSSGVGNTNENVIGATTGCGAGVLAFAELPSNDGWRIRFCDDNAVFADGPGTIGFSQFDFQAVLCHEYGHVLGLGHSADAASTMWPSINNGSESERSINADDIAGVQFIYGAKSSLKPLICKTETSGSTLTITGSGFDPSDNDVWFHRAAVSNPSVGPSYVVAQGLPSTAGGTQISVTIPATAGPGDVAVRLPGNANIHRLLSNAFPANFTGTIEANCPFQVSGFTPGAVEALIPGTAQTVTVTGVGLDNVTEITLEPSTVLSPSSWTIVDPGTITVDLPIAPNLGTNTLTLDTSSGSESINFTVNVPSSPIYQIGTGDPANPVFDGETLTATVAGLPGNTHRIYISISNLPSSHPLLMLDIANNFTQLLTGPDIVIGSNGIGQLSMPLAYMGAPAIYYTQSIDLSAGAPFAVSNLQSATLNP